MARRIETVSDEVFEELVALAVNLVFEALILLVLWPLGRIALAVSLAKGYGLFWFVLSVVALLVSRLYRIFRVDLYSHPNAFVNINLAVSGLLVTGWSAFAALTVQSFAGGASVPAAALLWFIGFVSNLVACMIVGSFYAGHIYRLISLPLALVSFVVFAIWPMAGKALYGWFFALF